MNDLEERVKQENNTPPRSQLSVKRDTGQDKIATGETGRLIN